MHPSVLTLSVALLLSAAAHGQQPKLSEHARRDVERHRTMAAAHEEAARCLEAGKAEEECLKALQQRCKGLAIGKFCGMKHEH